MTLVAITLLVAIERNLLVAHSKSPSVAMASEEVRRRCREEEELRDDVGWWRKKGLRMLLGCTCC